MDEVDGMSAGDWGGIADLISSIKTLKIPTICICNDRYSQKLKSLVNYCLLLSFQKPTKQQVFFYSFSFFVLRGNSARLDTRLAKDIRKHTSHFSYSNHLLTY